MDGADAYWGELSHGRERSCRVNPMDANELALRVRRMCEQGRLPSSETGVFIGSASGTGEACHVCGETIESQSPDMELRATVRRVERIYRLHPRCFLAWRRYCGAKG